MTAHFSPRNTPLRTATALLGLGGILVLGACAPESASETTPEGGASAPDGGVQSLSPGATEGAETTDTMASDATNTADSDAAGSGTGESGATADYTASMQDIESEVGTAQIREMDGAMEFTVEVSGMEPGFYGLHVHEIGECNPDSAAPDDPSELGAFLSAGSHIGADESDHPDHAGDLPPILVQESGEGHLTFQTDRLTAEHLQDEDGAAMMLHSDPDNFANIPERYAPDGPDEDTTGTGDAGFRWACGVVETAG
ncbi:superoxide dismutase [Cu-Zn] [Citricoccus zhacaiensis]|uniref:Superoxide dismutase [Cu-Zn] n=1 Tax=Citricoccus zhacaiensis TaxID=489142 RepID=A0ABQ2LZF4_9MICC|nr:superoxide dismutase family protein [Citricoccus zhacaiensis]GGO45290.1 superoxide dismutase [Cu-Zn] [Citricoccus zhacaiensis]